MADPRIEELARRIVTYAVALNKDEKVMINCTPDALPLAKAIVREAYKVGGVPFVNFISEDLTGELNRGATREQTEYLVENEAWKTRDMAAIVNINVPQNVYELDIAARPQREAVAKWTYETKCRIGIAPMRPDMKWTVLTYPSYSVARNAEMPLEEYEELYFAACLIDYEKLSVAMNALARRMMEADMVHIKGVGTDLTFCIKDCPTEISAGTWNVPDGEVLCVPVIDSANGYITYNVPSLQQGIVFENVRLELTNGKITGATANRTAELNAILDTDDGARYIGEFALGTNTAIKRPTGSILFDEKMAGSLHFTPGQQIARIGNGNQSQIHWDLVYCQLLEYGGGEIWFDKELVRKDGMFLAKEFELLNPKI